MMIFVTKDLFSSLHVCTTWYMFPTAAKTYTFQKKRAALARRCSCVL